MRQRIEQPVLERIICDRCGAEIKKNEQNEKGEVVVCTYNSKSEVEWDVGKYDLVDLCLVCWASFHDWREGRQYNLPVVTGVE